MSNEATGRGFCGTNQTRQLNHGERWSGEPSHAGEGPLAIEDTGQGTSATQTKTLVGGPGAPWMEEHSRSKTLVRGPVPAKRRHWSGDQGHLGWKSTRDRRHWSGDQCHPNEDTGQGTSATQTKTLVRGPGAPWMEEHSRSKTLVRGPVPPRRRHSFGDQGHLGWKSTRDRRHWSGDQCHPDEDTRRGTRSTRMEDHSRLKTLVRGPVPPKRRHWSGDQGHLDGRPLAIEDTGQGTSATQTKTLVGGPGALGWKTTRD